VKRIRRGFIAALIIVSLVAVSFLGLSVANSGNDKFSRDLSKLEEDYKELQTRYYALLGNYSNLESRYKSILFESISPAAPSGSSNDASTAMQHYKNYTKNYNQNIINTNLITVNSKN